METLCRIFMVLSLATIVCSLELPEKFRNEDHFYIFYYNWLQVKSQDEFRNIQTGYIDLLANKSVNPCDNFYEYACGGYSTKFPRVMQRPNHGLLFVPKTALGDVEFQLFSTPVEDGDVETTKKMKLLYQTCANKNATRLSDLDAFIGSLGKWPFLEPGWTESQFDWVNVTGHAALYGLNTFFSTKLEVKDGVLHNVLGKPVFQKDVLDRPSWWPNVTAYGFNTDEAQLQLVRDFSAKLLNLPVGEDAEVSYALSEVKQTQPALNLEKYFQVLYGSDVLPPGDFVVLSRPRYFEALANLLAETDSKTVANYVFSKLWYDVLESFYVAGRHGCSKMLVNTCKHAAVVEFMATFGYKDESADKVNAVFNGVQDEVKTAVGSGFDEHFKYSLQYPEYTKLHDLTEEEYSTYQVNQNNFYESLVNLHKLKNTARRRFKQGPSLLTFDYNIKVVSNDADALVKIMAYTFLPPRYHTHSLPVMNFAGLGSYFADHLLRVAVNETLVNDRASVAKCFFSKAGSENKDLDKFSTDVSVKALAADLAYKAYKKTDQFDAQQFFLVYAQAFCDSAELEKTQTVGSGSVHDVLMNSAEFSTAYNCPVGSHMNPKKNC